MPTDLQALGRAVKQVQWRHHRALERRLVAIGSSLVQWDALRAIDRDPGASAHELAAATFQSDQAFATLAQRLLALGVIERRAAHGRRLEHHLTPEGERVLAQGSAIADEVLAESFAPLKTAEQRQLLELLIRLG
jgi:DNA-binding MarR family transcriptional regulator